MEVFATYAALMHEPNMAALGRTLSNETRVAILCVLLDGRPFSGTAVARAARVSAPAASFHLRKLQEAGLVLVQRDGRLRLFRLASETVAETIEQLGRIADCGQLVTLRGKEAAQLLAVAR